MEPPPPLGLRQITTDELRRALDGGDELVLVDALSPLSFAHSRLPGAINIPPDRVDDLAHRRIPDRRRRVVVYCAGPDCDTSVEVGRRLADLGYEDVLHYAAGKRGWEDAGFRLETGRREARVRPSSSERAP